MDSTLESIHLRLDRFLESNHSTDETREELSFDETREELSFDETREELGNIMSSIKTKTDQLNEIIAGYRARMSDMYACAQSCTPDEKQLMELNMELANQLFARKKQIFIALDIHYKRSKELIHELEIP